MESETLRHRILITGGSGFIGTNLVDFLSRSGCQVRNLDISPPLNSHTTDCWHRQDILDSSGLLAEFKQFAPTHLVHLAARTDLGENDSIDGYAANTIGVKNVLQAAAQTAGIQRLIIASSMLVCRIGYTPKTDTDYCPPNYYGQSKVLTETITREFNPDIPWTIIRPTTIWGPWSVRYRDEFFRVLRNGRYLHPGKNRIMKTYGYVGNVVHQINAILHASVPDVHGKTLYVSDPPLDLREWVDGFSFRLRGRGVREAPLAFLRLLAQTGDMFDRFGIRLPLTSFRLGNMTADNVIDMSPTFDITGPGPFTLDNGLDETVRWLNNDAFGKPL